MHGVLPQPCPPYKIENQNDSNIEEMAAVVFPLSFNQLLVGYPVEEKVDIDIHAFREAVAYGSMDFFVAAFDSDGNRRLHKNIGIDSGLISDDEIADITASLF